MSPSQVQLRPTVSSGLTLGLLFTLGSGTPTLAQPAQSIDLASLTTAGGELRRVYGSTGSGASGVPVAAGGDVDGDGFEDVAFGAMRASPFGRTQAGEVYLAFGDGTVGGDVDTGVSQPGVLVITGAAARENAGSELWIDDVTGDGLADVLVCRQNYSHGGRTGAGALTIVPGGSGLRAHAATLQALDLAAPPPGLGLTTVIGGATRGRLGIWVRTGDVTGDGVADLVVGADQRGSAHNGGAWVLRGGPHLVAAGNVDLALFGLGSFGLSGHAARIDPPPFSSHYHFGATVQIADLDGNGRGEVLIAAALNRAGAALPPLGDSFSHATGGTADGTLFIAWDDALAEPWANGFSFIVDGVAARSTVIDGAAANVSFSEEILGGLDYDGDGDGDLFVGDIVGTGVNGSFSGLGHVFFDAALLKGLDFDLGAPPPGLRIATLHGPIAGAIFADTAAHGDFNGDGVADLAVSSPHDAPSGRTDAGTLHVFLGRRGDWPTVVNLAPGMLPPSAALEIVEIYGANGDSGGNQGDTLAYSAAAGDLDGNGCSDLVSNEMLGDGAGPGTVDVGNLIAVSSTVFGCLYRDGFESGSTGAWSLTVP